MSCPARIGAFAVVSLVLLRLATGWHFFQEGTKKLNDPSWSSAGFLIQAKGPLADFYHSKVPQVHDWRGLLAQPQEAGYIDEGRIEEMRKWEEAYEEEIEAAREAGEPIPFKISEFEPYARWADQIVADWQYTLESFFELPNLTDEEMDQAAEALEAARRQLVDYLEQIEPEIREYQHELFRIEQMEKQGATGGLAFHDERIRSKQAEASQMVQPWLAEVTAIEEDYHDKLRHIYRIGAEAREVERAEADDRPPAAATEDATADANVEDGADVAPEAATSSDEQEPASEREGLPPSPEAASAESSAEDDAAAEETAPNAAETAAVAADEVADDAAAADDADVAAAGPPDGPEESEEAVSHEVSKEEIPEVEPLTIQDVLTNTKEAELELVDKVVSWSHVIIGACLVVGLFTPIAALGGAIFLAMVISTQPPWVAGTQETYYQFVEMFGLLVLAATCAGRWAGLDYFFACLFGKCRRSE